MSLDRLVGSCGRVCVIEGAGGNGDKVEHLLKVLFLSEN